MLRNVSDKDNFILPFLGVKLHSQPIPKIQSDAERAVDSDSAH